MIKIAERLRPFSHESGVFVLLPGSSFRLQVFPQGIVVEDLLGPVPLLLANIEIPITGPVREFTVQQDLEKGCVRIWGFENQGFFRYELYSTTDCQGILFHLQKGRGEAPLVSGKWSLAYISQNNQQIFIGPSNEDVSSKKPYNVPLIERLSLGNNKAQDWSLIHRRKQMEEILPLWHRLGQLIPLSCQNDSALGASLFGKSRDALLSLNRQEAFSFLHDLFSAGFEGALSPRLIDQERQGIFSGPLSSADSPLYLLTEGARFIRSLFIQEHHSLVSLFPKLPSEFHCGRFINVPCGNGGVLNMEWTKKAPRRISFVAGTDQNIAFLFPRDQVRCRFRTSPVDKGIVYQSGSPMQVSAKQTYWLDNFQK